MSRRVAVLLAGAAMAALTLAVESTKPAADVLRDADVRARFSEAVR